MRNIFKNRIIAFFLAVFMVLPLVAGSIAFADTSAKVFYIDAANGFDTNDGKTKDTAFQSLTAAYSAAGNDDFVVYIVGKYTLPSSAPDNKASYYGGKMTLLGYDESSVLTLTDSSPAFLGGEAVVDNITFKNGSNAYLEARGHKVTFGENVTTDGYHWIHTGDYLYRMSDGGEMEFLSGTYNYVYMGSIVHTEVKTIPGDVKLTLGDATINMLTVGNTGWGESFKGSVFDGNILIKLDGGKVNTLMVSTGNYDCTFNGAMQVIVNHGSSVSYHETFRDETFAGGKYIVNSGAGGSVDFVSDKDGKSVAGKVYVTMPRGASAVITNGQSTKTITASGEVTLEPGTTDITYNLPKIFYIDAVNGLDTNDGKTKETAFQSITAAYSAAGSSDFIVYIVGEYVLPTSTVSSTTALYSGRMTITGYDENSVLAIKDGNPGFLEGTTHIENITFKNGTSAYLIANGHKVTLGKNVKDLGYHQIVMGTFNNRAFDGGEMEITSGTYTYFIVGSMAHSVEKTVSGDMKLTLDGGGIHILELGNAGWSSVFTGSVFNGNILIKLDSGIVNSFRAATANYESTYNGAVQVIVNNRTQVTFDKTFEDKQFAKGKYIVYSEPEGYVDHAYDALGNSIAGSVSITVPEGKYAKITCGGTETVLEKSGIALLSAGTSYVTYDDISNLTSVKVTDGNNVYKYPVAETVNISHGGAVTFPEKMEKEGYVFGGWYSDADFTVPVINGSAVSEGTLFAKWIELDPTDLYVEGVQIRITGNQGLRFISSLTHSTRGALIALSAQNSVLSPENPDFNKTTGIGYGTVLFPADLAGDSDITKDTVCTLGGKQYMAYPVAARKTFAISDGFDSYTAVLTDIQTKEYLRNYTARPYITYTDASGMTRTVYGESYSANVYDTALYIYENGASAEPEGTREYLFANILSKVDKTTNPLANAYRALMYDKKLTVGYLGGSITFGVSAANDMVDDDGSVVKGDISLSYANRVTTWLEETFPEATIEYVNAGISDTATNFGNYRLQKHLMNTNGHDMPDLVFVEYTSNDWTYNDASGKQDVPEFRRQIESLVRNIYSYNPYCDIVFVFSTRGKYGSRPAFIEVAEHYGLQYIDMGIPLQALMTERGAANETQGNYYYTVDNLHPSSIGYAVYFEELKKVLAKRLVDEPVYSAEKTDRLASYPGYINKTLWLDPQIITASSLNAAGADISLSGSCNSMMYGLSKTQMQSVVITPDSYKITGTDAKITFEFTGTTFSAIFNMTASGVNMDYTIDGTKKNFTIDKGTYLSFQMSPHTQLFVIEQELDYGKHTVELTFKPTSDGKVDVQLGGIGVAGASVK